jgi:hypothetical protein
VGKTQFAQPVTALESYNASWMKQETVKPPTGLDAVIEAYKKDVDVTLIRENLRLTVHQRFQQLMQLQKFAEELRHAGRKARSRR